MPTSVHIPRQLLAKVDRRAKELRISRNRLIVQVLERELDRAEWSGELFEALARIDHGTAKLFEESMQVVRTARRSKGPPRL